MTTPKATAGLRSSPSTCYLAVLPLLMDAAKECGYALGAHGTMNRDLDLIAAPWTEEATDDLTLARTLAMSCAGKIYEMKTHADGSTGPNPTPKPHGRMGWTIHLGGGLYLDVSVMPRRPDND